MEIKERKLVGNTLHATIQYTHKDRTEGQVNVVSPQYICGPVFLQIKLMSWLTDKRNDIITAFIYIKFMKMNEQYNLKYTCQLCSKKLEADLNITEDNVWHKIDDGVILNNNIISFDISITIDLASTESPFAVLYDDTDSTDFELKGEDGSVEMHKAILACSSPVLRTMLRGKWKETTECRVNVTGTSKQTLEHFKDYIYLHKLPETGLEQLLLLASYYMMPNLVQKCAVKLLSSLTAQNALELAEFAIKFKVNHVLMVILKCIQNGIIKVEDMPAQSDWNYICKETCSTIAK